MVSHKVFNHLCLLMAFSCLTCLFRLTSGHGLMCHPRQRGAYVSQKCGSNLPFPKNPVIDYCAHCLNGGGKETVRQNLHPNAGWILYEPTVDFTKTATRAGLCGDAKGTDDHMIGGTFVPSVYGGAPLVAHWKTGSTVDFTAEIDTNHNGYFEFFLCDLDKCGTKDIRGECFMKNTCYKLMRVKHEECENPSPKTHTKCGPIDEKYPGRWYVPCRETEHVGIHIVGGSSGTMRYKLPDGVNCEHCVVQWYWATANACAPRGFLDYMIRKNKPFGTTCPSDGGGSGAFREGMTECGGDSLPEEFWSCADVKISPNGGSAGGIAGGEGDGTSPDSNDDSDDGVDGESTSGEETPEEESSGTGSDGEAGGDSGNNGDESGDSSGDGDAEGEEDDTDGPSNDPKDECMLEGDSCGGESRCCENLELVCVLQNGEMSPRCAVWWKLGNTIR